MPEEPQTPEPTATDEPHGEQPEVDWKAEARKWEQRAKENSQRLKEAEPALAEYHRLVEASKTDLERTAEEATRWQSEAEKWRSASVASTIESRAASAGFADPSDAVSNLDKSKYLDAGGVIDTAAMDADLAALLEVKPHYKRTVEPSGPRVPAPNRAQGAAGASGASPADEFAAILRGKLAG